MRIKSLVVLRERCLEGEVLEGAGGGGRVGDTLSCVSKTTSLELVGMRS